MMALAVLTSGVSSASANDWPSTDAVTTIVHSDGVVETLVSGPDKPTADEPSAGATDDPLTTCDPTCGTGGIMPPVTLTDTAMVKYSRLNDDLEATESTKLTGQNGFVTYNTQFCSNSATFIWWGDEPSYNWQSYAPAFNWTQTGIDISVSVPPGIGFSGGSDDVTWSGGQGGSGRWSGTISYQQKVGFSAVVADTAKFESTAAIWLGGNSYGVSANSSDAFGPAA